MMNAKPVVTLIATTLFSISCYAHDCSGGSNGGMDATGNQCNDTAVYESASNDTTRDAPSTTSVAPATTLSHVSYAAPSAKTSKRSKHNHVALSVPRN